MASSRRFSRLGWTTAGASLLLTLAVVAAGCGSSGGSNASPPTTVATTTGGAAGPTGAAQTAAFRAFQTCLQNHGLSGFGGGGFRRGVTGARGPTGRQGPTGARGATGRRGPSGGFFGRNLTAAQQKAFNACRSKLPAGSRFGGGRGVGGGASGNPAFAKYTKCLSQHGVKFGSSSSNAAAFRKASAACAKYRPAVGGGGQTTAGG